MKEHLSGDQALEWMMGLRDAECEAHLRGCPECVEAIGKVAAPLRLFGAAVRELGSEVRTGKRAENCRRSWRLAYWPAALLAATLLIFAVLPLQRGQRQAGHGVTDAAVAVSDEVLLQHVESELSESVPGSMEPLARLMTNETGRTR
jgi:hypothetical protein